MENNLDKYFRDNLNDRKFELKDEYWLAAEKLLEADDRRRKRRGAFWWFFGGAALVLLLVGGLMLLKSKGNDPQYSTTAGATEAAGSASTQPIAPSRTQQPSINSTANSVEQNIGLQNEAILNDENDEKNASFEPKPNTPVLNNQTKRSQQQAEKSQLGTGSSNFFNNNKSSNKSSNSINQNSAIAKNGQELKDADRTTIIPNNHQENIENESTAISFERIKSINFLAILKPYVKHSSIKPELATTTIKIEVVEKNKLNLEFIALQYGQPLPDKGEKALLGQRVGLLLRKDFSSGLYISSGLLYQHRNGSFDATKSALQRNYRFGLELDTLLLRPTSLHYVSLPILLGIERNRHHLECGILLDYLTGVQGETGSYQKQGEPPIRAFEKEKSGWVTTDGYRRLVPTLQLGYRHQIARRWAIGLSAIYNIGGILDKGFEPPLNGFTLKEANKLVLGLQLNYRIK